MGTEEEEEETVAPPAPQRRPAPRRDYDDDDDGGARDEQIPKWRFDKVNNAKKEYRDEAQQLRMQLLEKEAEITKLRTEHEAKLTEATEKAEEYRAEVDKMRHEVFLARDGLQSEEALAYLRWKYDSAKVEDGKEKPSFEDWYGQAKEDESYTHLFNHWRGGGQPKESKPKAPRPKPPGPSAHEGARAPTSTEPLGWETISKMTPAEYRAHRDSGAIPGVAPKKKD